MPSQNIDLYPWDSVYIWESHRNVLGCAECAKNEWNKIEVEIILEHK
jgi:hypothetical protein